MWTYGRAFRQSVVLVMLACLAGMGRGQVDARTNGAERTAQSLVANTATPARTQRRASRSRARRQAAKGEAAGGNLTAGNIYSFAGAISNSINATTGGGTGGSGFGNYAPGDDSNPANEAGVLPTGVALDAAGNLYIADYGNDLIREVPIAATPGINRILGSVWTGNSEAPPWAGISLNSCGELLYGGSTTTCNLDGQALALAGDLFDMNFNLQGAAVTIPQDLKLDANGNVYFVDAGDQVLEVLYKAGTVPGLTSPTPGYVYTLAGQLDTPTTFPVSNVSGTSGGTGEAGAASTATFGGTNYANSTYANGVALMGGPGGLFLDAAGNIYIADTFNNLVRVIYQADPAPPVLAAVGITVTDSDKGNIYTIAGSYVLGSNSLTNACSSTDPNIAGNNCGEGGPATAAWLYNPTGVYVDSSGNIFFADTDDNVVRAIYVAGNLPGITNPTVGNLYTIAGNAPNLSAPPVAAMGGFTYPANACLTTNLNNCGDGGPALSAQLYLPAYVTEDKSGNLYISDSGDNVVRVIYESGQLAGLPAQLTQGSLYTYAGTIVGAGADSSTVNMTNPGVPLNACDAYTETNDCGNSGAAIASELYNPQGLVFDGNNNLYIADWYDGAVREVAGVAPLQAQTITFPSSGTLPASVVYGNAPIPLTATASSGLPVTFTVTGAAKLVGSTAAIESVGTITITASQAGGSGYLPAAPVTATIQVTPAALTVTGSATTIEFGSPIPNFSGDYAITGFEYSDNQGSATSGAPAVTPQPAYTPTTPVGTKIALVVTQGTLAANDGNYTFKFVNGSLTITGGAAQTITFPAIPNQTYGAAPFTLNATASSGLPITYTVSAGAPVTLSGSVLTITGADPAVTITASQAGSNVYAPAASVSHTFAINPAPLTVAANNVSVIQNGTIPPLTYTITGFVNGDTQPTATTGLPVLVAGAASSAPVGTYPITIAAGSFVAANYNPTFVNGTLTILQPKPQTISFTAPPSPVTYGTANIPLTATANSGLPVTFAVTSGPGILVGGSAVQVTGAGTITISASQPGNSVYGPAPTVTQSISVAPALLTVTATSYTIAVASPVPALGYTFSGFVNGDTSQIVAGAPAITTTYTGPPNPPGVYPISITQGTLAAANYMFTVLSGSITVLFGPPPDFTVNTSATTVTMQPGQLQQLTVLATPINGYDNPYSSSTATGGISFSCANLPANITCNFTPASVSVNGSDTLVGPAATGASSTLTISATSAALAMSLPGREGGNNGVLPAAIFFLPGGLAGAFVGCYRKRFVKNIRGYQALVLICLLAGVMGMGACGYSNSQNTSSFAKPGTTTIQVQAVGAPADSATGATGTITHTVNVTVTIQ